MKKYSFLLLLTALLVIFTVSISAEGAEVSLTSCTAFTGDDITVKVNMDENPGFIASVINISYDSKVFTLKTVKDMELLGTNNHSDNISSELYSLSWFNPLSEEDYDATGTVAELTFSVDEKAEGGSHAIKIEVKEMWNTELQAVAVSEEVAADINIIKYLCETEGDTVTITGVEGTLSGKVELPGILDGKNVTAIAAEAFKGCGEITEITVPDGVKTVGAGAFENCTKLEKINLPADIEAVGKDILKGTALYGTAGNWENGALYIDKYLVDINDNEMTEFSVKAGTALIASGTLKGCASLETLTLPKSIRYIGENAFEGCGVLSEVIYQGSESNWENVTVASGNDALLNAGITFAVTSIPGDVTGDGEVTRADLLRLAKHFSGFTVEFDEVASDVTGDGEVTRADLLRLAKHFSGFDVELGA